MGENRASYRIVKDRLHRVTNSPHAAQIPYAMIGDHAVQHWVAQVDEAVVRNTRDVDIILNRADLARAAAELAPHGQLCGLCLAGQRHI
ncbi:MAG: hypothetical protein SFX18_11150 [Pirellulales bacterium]|nr:hypothetical protein [Pirellulales bacterium]